MWTGGGGGGKGRYGGTEAEGMMQRDEARGGGVWTSVAWWLGMWGVGVCG